MHVFMNNFRRTLILLDNWRHIAACPAHQSELFWRPVQAFLRVNCGSSHGGRPSPWAIYFGCSSANATPSQVLAPSNAVLPRYTHGKDRGPWVDILSFHARGLRSENLPHTTRLSRKDTVPPAKDDGSWEAVAGVVC
ncbi:hypothetical protein G7K_0604-t1 [Saitoella complicata NRRL Y-17804]|uniref:Uncharacterized protein n=1 Tax=Saitoella complicata (strain BCRC 22490 / CBS 7301 / JCM 7358 / NBRC 10748 / NRRL Y-17804) TaxID=698492 RepID=A0A0E9N9B2_SAICN|nr:hypothetical protein G7K_0604-t1 [Saitoella complicata NRRL Y-17804]